MKYAHLAPNKKVGDYAYNHQALLGTGAFGKVYLGRELKSKSLVAIKVLENDQITDPYLKEALLKEISLMKKLKGPNIVRFLDTLKSVNHTYIIQEFCSGGDFRAFLTKRGKIPEPEARRILLDFLNGFSELVKLGYLHRDLKPENVLIEGNVFKLADFGFATQVHSFQSSLLKTVVGTPLYMAPQILAHEEYTSKSDVWSTGLIFYEMLFGKTPWPARNQVELLENIKKMPMRFPFDVKVSEASKDFLKGCLQLSEKSRFGWEQVFAHPVYSEAGGCSPLNKIGKKATITISEKSLSALTELQEIIQRHNVDLKKVFKNFDRHGDGTLDMKEFASLMKCINDRLSAREVEEIFQRFDSDGSGEIDFNEFQRVLMETDYNKASSGDNQLLMDYRGDKMFKHLVNVIHNNRIDIDEIFKDGKKGMKELGFEEFRAQILRIDDSMNDNDIRYVFMKFDANQDKQIELQEFKNVLQAELANIPGYSEKVPISKVVNPSNSSVSARRILDELRSIITKNGLNVQWVFDHFDSSGDRSLDFSEFQNLIAVFNARYSELEVREVFRLLDINGDGDISLKEFECFLK